METMAHLSCVGETTEGLIEILDRLEAAGIENVLALRGDPPRGEAEFKRPEGGLDSAADLAAFISERYPFAIGGACFPEVHPEAPSLEADLAYLKTKVTSGATFLITQLFFDNRVYFEFVGAARAAGIDVPIIPGVIPITSYARITRFCELCAASIPKQLAEAMEALAGDHDAEAELGTAYAARQCEELLAGGAPGIHFYTLNTAPRPARCLARCASRGPGSELPRAAGTRSGTRGAQLDSPPWLTRRILPLPRPSDRLRRPWRRRARPGPDPRPADEPPHVRSPRARDGLARKPGGDGRSARPRRSGKPADMRIYSMSSFAKQVAALVEHLGLRAPVVGGTSLGANVGLELAVHHPESAGGLLVEMPVLEDALVGAALIFTPMLLSLRFGKPLLIATSQALQRVPRTNYLADILLDLLRRDPESSQAVLEGVLFAGAAPPPEERRRSSSRRW